SGQALRRCVGGRCLHRRHAYAHHESGVGATPADRRRPRQRGLLPRAGGGESASGASDMATRRSRRAGCCDPAADRGRQVETSAALRGTGSDGGHTDYRPLGSPERRLVYWAVPPWLEGPVYISTITTSLAVPRTH